MFTVCALSRDPLILSVLAIPAEILCPFPYHNIRVLKVNFLVRIMLTITIFTCYFISPQIHNKFGAFHQKRKRQVLQPPLCHLKPN